MEGRRNKKKEGQKEEGIQGEMRNEKKKENKASPGFKGVRLVLLVFCLIFQCPLSFVSDLHICWNTVGCSLCSSDQLGISLALRGSGLLNN